MDIQVLKQYIDQAKDIQKLRDYFDRYNTQLQEVNAERLEIYASEDLEIDTSEGLGAILEDIDSLEYDKNKYCGVGGINGQLRARMHDSRYHFCTSVLLYFGETGEVPDYNVREIMKAVEKNNLHNISNSFHKFADELTAKVSSLTRQNA